MSESINEIGRDIWNDEEIKEEDERMEKARFFRDGALMECVLTGVDKEDKVGKISGKPFVRHTYRFQSADGRDKELIDYDFAMTNALDRFKRDGVKLKIGQKMMITPIKTGVNDNGYDIFKYDVQLGEATEVAKPEPKKEEIKIEDIPF